MRTRRNLLAVMAIIIFCCIAVWLSAPIQGGEKKYEIKSYLDVSPYLNTPSRPVDAYEHRMERYMDLAETNFITTSRDIENISQRIASIDNRLTKISRRLARIEKHLGITQPKPKLQKQSQEKDMQK